MTAPSNPYRDRWRWWYPAIADWMIRNPQGKLTDCAKELGKHVNTISMITNTDLFRDYLARRRQDWQQIHDDALREKTMRVATASLDAIALSLEKKKDQVPIGMLNTIATSALDRLGYSPNKQAPAVGSVHVHQNGSGPLMVAVNADALREAQQAIRTAEARRSALAQPIATEIEDVVDAVPDEVSSFVESALKQLDEPSRDSDAAEGLPRTLPSDQ